jgi:hypothetical protein
MGKAFVVVSSIKASNNSREKGEDREQFRESGMKEGGVVDGATATTRDSE